MISLVFAFISLNNAFFSSRGRAWFVAVSASVARAHQAGRNDQDSIDRLRRNKHGVLRAGDVSGRRATTRSGPHSGSPANPAIGTPHESWRSSCRPQATAGVASSDGVMTVRGQHGTDRLCNAPFGGLSLEPGTRPPMPYGIGGTTTPSRSRVARLTSGRAGERDGRHTRYCPWVRHTHLDQRVPRNRPVALICPTFVTPVGRTISVVQGAQLVEAIHSEPPIADQRRRRTRNRSESDT